MLKGMVKASVIYHVKKIKYFQRWFREIKDTKFESMAQGPINSGEGDK